MYVKEITADDNDVDVKPYASLKGILLTPGSDAATAVIYDAATTTGKKLATVKAPAGQSVFIGFPDGMLEARTAISVDVTGTSPLCYLYLD